MKTLRSWYRTPLGRLLEAAEKDVLGRRLDTMTGTILLQLGGFGDESRLDAHTARQWVTERIGAGATADCWLDYERLPFHSSTMDIVVLVHALEFSRSPHTVLREAERVLTPEGTLLILGFNPWSSWGLTRAWRGHSEAAGPWGAHYVRPGRVRDWLMLLGLEVGEFEYAYFRPPWGGPRAQQRLRVLERIGTQYLPWFGGVYLASARKRVVGLTPLRPRWQRERRLVGGGLAQPTSRNY